MTGEDGEQKNMKPSETPPRRVQKKKKRRRNKKKKGKKFTLERPAEPNFMLVPKNPEPTKAEEEPQPEALPIPPVLPGAGFMPLPFFPFGAPPPSFIASPNIEPGTPMEIGGTTFFTSTAPGPATFDPLSLLPSHDPIAIMKQVEWYFQEDNLKRDIFLRQAMNERGYVPADTIASFNRLKAHGITKDEILHCCRGSTVVKVKNDKIKCRDLWYTWVLPGDKVTSIVASDDEDLVDELVAASAAAAVPDLTQAKPFTNQVLTANEFFNIFREPPLNPVEAAV